MQTLQHLVMQMITCYRKCQEDSLNIITKKSELLLEILEKYIKEFRRYLSQFNGCALRVMKKTQDLSHYTSTRRRVHAATLSLAENAKLLQRVFEKLFKDRGYALFTICVAGFLLAFYTANYFLVGGSFIGGIMGSLGNRG